jgi:hypothetical protein
VDEQPISPRRQASSAHPGVGTKTIDNGCTQAEALSAAGKVAELLDRYDLSLTDVEIRAAP